MQKVVKWEWIPSGFNHKVINSESLFRFLEDITLKGDIVCCLPNKDRTEIVVIYNEKPILNTNPDQIAGLQSELNKSDQILQKVKRDSDGKIFEIGGHIICKNQVRRITEIKIINREIVLFLNPLNNDPYGQNSRILLRNAKLINNV